jgi:sugar-specific transcriptional regulator TrmB
LIKTLYKCNTFFFEKLWESSIPANERIAEIKRMMFDNNLLNTKIRDLYTIKGLIPKVIQSAVEEILLFFPTINSFWLIEENNGIIELLANAVNRYIKVKIIIHIDNEDSNANKTIDKKINDVNKVLGTYVNYTTKKIDTKTIMLIADQAISLSIYIKDNDKNTFKDAIEMASFSNNELNVSTLLSFFDSLWIRTEIGKQNIIKQTYFKIFKEPQLRDENYRRKWSFEHTTNE